ARRLDSGDHQALRAALGDTTRVSGGDLIVALGQPLGRILTHGSVALYRPGAAAPLEYRLLDVDPGGVATAAFNRGPQGGLRQAWVRLADGGLVGLLPGDAHHPLWGSSDRLVHLTGAGSPTALTVACAVRWGSVESIPPIAEPARLPGGAGAA